MAHVINTVIDNDEVTAFGSAHKRINDAVLDAKSAAERYMENNGGDVIEASEASDDVLKRLGLVRGRLDVRGQRKPHSDSRFFFIVRRS